VNPFYLGTRERRIFAIYEPAVGRREQARAAVLCYPWGPEYVFAHRCMRQLAAKLAVAGFHTLRFDFFGSGDSGGDMLQADLAGWGADTELAIEAIRDIAGVSRVTLVGMRLGANVAALTAARTPTACDTLVLWDPIVSGSEYLRCLLAQSRTAASAEGGSVEIEGFPLTQRMMRDIEAIDFSATMNLPACRSLMLVTEPGQPALPAQAASPAEGALTLEFLPSPCPWIESVTTTGAVPARAIQRIAEWLS
jgi:uncharacterized protein